MTGRLPPEVKLFAHYSIPRPETYTKIGEYVCGTPLHVTFAGIITRNPITAIERLRSILGEVDDIPHMTTDRIVLSHGHYRIKPIITLHDTAQKLTALQTQVFDAMAAIQMTRLAGGTQYADGRTPHVTIDRIYCAPVLPKEFDIDHIMVTTGSKIAPGHWHNYVWDVIPLADASH